MPALAKWVLISVAALIALIIGFFAVQWLRAAGAAAPYEGAFEVAALSAPARIVRDEHAVPHIYGETIEDVLFAQGFAHAQDRLWQMDLTRRNAQGRVAELLGEPAFANDRLMRALGFAQNVEATWAQTPAADRRLLEAYAAGVNAWIEHEDFKLPAEYVLTLTKPEPWRPTDTLYVWKSLWFALGQNIGSELGRARLEKAVGPEIARDFFRPYPEDGHVAMEWTDLARALGLEEEPALGPAPEAAPGFEGTVSSDGPARNSNNWVLTGARTASGEPMLAADPHLPISMPGFWYLAHLAFPDGSVVGATIPGVPGVGVGRSETLAWGATASAADIQDLYIEKLNPEDPNQYKTPDGWADFETREETIKVRFGKDRVTTMRRSRHGPVFPPEALSAPTIDEETQALAFAWTALKGADDSWRALLAINAATSIEDMLAAVNDYSGPVFNIVFAHVDGDAGLIVTGRIPVRDPAHETMGRSPADGANPDNDWRGYIPVEMSPLVVNPESGALVTANAKVEPDEYPYFITTDYAPPTRQRRIQTLIDARDRHDAESFKAIQLDRRTGEISKVLPLMLATRPADQVSARALDMMREWDGAWSADASAPLIYAAWSAELSKALYADELGPLFERYWTYDPILIQAILGEPLSDWCDDRRTESVEACTDQLSASLARAAQAIEGEFADGLDTTWGEVFKREAPHLGLAALPIVGARFSRAIAEAAGPGAPNVGYFRFADSPRFKGGSFAPSLRMVFDFADLEAAEFAVTSGQSGHFASPHYDDLQKIWSEGGYIRIPTAETAIAAPRIIELSPQ